MNIIKIAMFAIVGVMLCEYLKNIKSQLNMLLLLLITVTIYIAIYDKLLAFIKLLDGFRGYLSVEGKEYIGLMIKMIIISYIGEMTSSICKDMGYNSIASSVVIITKLSIMVLGTSVIWYLLKIIEGVIAI